MSAKSTAAKQKHILVIVANPGNGTVSFGSSVYEAGGHVVQIIQEVTTDQRKKITEHIPLISQWEKDPVGVFLLRYDGDPAQLPGWEYCPCRDETDTGPAIECRHRLLGKEVSAMMWVYDSGTSFSLLMRALFNIDITQ